MTWLLGGASVFGLYVIYDINSVKWKHPWLHISFLLGSAVLAGLTVRQVFAAFAGILIRPFFWLWAVLALISLLLLIYTLFFALPFEKTYLDTGGKPQVYDRGMYALCRHPGVLWFFLFYLFLGLAFRPSELLRNGMFYSFLNLLYVVFQDIWTFPKTFAEYREYKKTTPFLIPNGKSVKRALSRT